MNTKSEETDVAIKEKVEYKEEIESDLKAKKNSRSNKGKTIAFATVFSKVIKKLSNK